MKKLFKVFTLLFLSNVALAQLKTNIYKANFSGADKRIVIMSANSSVEIIGIEGKEVIIEALEDKRELPNEADGLKIVSPGGGIDNTGVGANVVIEGNGMRIKIPKSKYFGNYKIKIPKEVAISVRENGNAYGKWQISDMRGEVEAQTSYTTLHMNNVSGPIVARGGYGKMYIVYDQLNQTKPNSISANGPIDITLPANTKANLHLKATYNEVFTDFDIQPVVKFDSLSKNDKSVKVVVVDMQNYYAKAGKIYDRFGNDVTTKIAGKVAGADRANVTGLEKKSTNMSPEDAIKQLSSRHIDNNDDDDCEDCPKDGSTVGTINGGGVELKIKSDYGNIYLRKKK